MKTKLTAILLALSLPGCFVFDDTIRHADAGQSKGDAGDSGPPDAGPLILDDLCGVSPPRLLLTRTTRNIAIDTTGLTNAVTSTCGGAPTLGHDAFIAVDVEAGAYWHFHLHNDTSYSDSINRQPALYLLNSGCDSRECTFSSDVCAASGDEHFGFVAPAAGRWYIGIDDRIAGGGHYLLDAFRPTCGDGTKEHGEACDDGDTDDGDGCNHACLIELTHELPAEREANDNPTEANFLVMDSTNEFVVPGGIGGSGTCRYGDNFAIDVPPGARVEVDVLDAAGAVCADSALTDGYDLALRNSSFTDVVSAQVDATTRCAQVRSPTLSGGVYFVTVVLPQESESAIPYKLRVRIVP